MTRGGCYIRVSTENQLENYSIEEQTDRLKSYCRAKDITIVKFYTDGGYSGGNINRPALKELLKDIENRKIDAVIVYKLDRLSRSQKDTLMLIEDQFLSNGVDFISVNENFDTSTPFGRAMIGILSVFAQLEKDQITERFTMGRIGRAKNGCYHGGAYAPTGYDYVNGTLIVNEYEALQVKELYERFAAGHTIHDCWQYMQKKYTTKYGAWKSETLVRNVLQNQVYLGKVKFKGVVYPGNHKPIITEDLFMEAQAVLKASKKGGNSCKRSPYRAATLLSGLIYCGKCGARFHGEHGHYSCYSRTKGDKKYVIDPDCRNKKWNIKELDALVIDCITGFHFSKLKNPLAAETSHPDFSVRKKEIDRQIEKLIDLYQIGTIPIESISEKISALVKEKKALFDYETISNRKEPAKKAFKTARDCFLELLTCGELQEKRYCLALLIEKIVINDDSVDIILRQL